MENERCGSKGEIALLKSYFEKIEHFLWKESAKLTETNRGVNGFGYTPSGLSKGVQYWGETPNGSIASFMV